eukprot:8758-Heterococcus_DN1.PRE.1
MALHAITNATACFVLMLTTITNATMRCCYLWCDVWLHCMIQESTICCAQDCETCDNTATISTSYIQSLLGKHSTAAAQCSPESIIASNRSCQRTTAP